MQLIDRSRETDAKQKQLCEPPVLARSRSLPPRRIGRHQPMNEMRRLENAVTKCLRLTKSGMDDCLRGALTCVVREDVGRGDCAQNEIRFGPGAPGFNVVKSDSPPSRSTSERGSGTNQNVNIRVWNIPSVCGQKRRRLSIFQISSSPNSRSRRCNGHVILHRFGNFISLSRIRRCSP